LANFVSPAMVRDYLVATNTSGQWSDGLIGSNVSAASANLQRWTGRQFEPQGSNSTVTKVFSSRGRTYVTIPDLRSATAVVHNDSTLTADETYYLVPDRMNTGVYTALQLPGLRDRGDHRSYSDWFDRNLDHWHWRGRLNDIPNDISITGVWGHHPYPEELLHATKVLAAYYTIRSDALLSGARQTPDGNVFDLSNLPREVQDFVRDWKLGDYN
jgi:hypothetical protein